MKLFSYVFLLLTVILTLFGINLLWRHYNPFQLRFSSLPQNTVTVQANRIPTMIQIPSLHLTIPIIPSKVTGHVWETTDKGVSYATSTPIPGEKGNSIIYGHNFTNILGNLPKIAPHATITVVFSDHTQETFVVDKAATVTPDNTEVLKSSDTPVLTIYTCTGFLDSKRFVVRAIPS